MTRFKKMHGGRGGWCEWVCPTPKGYLMKCCDCGLVHEMEFAVFAETNQNQRRGTFTVNKLPWPLRAMFRARRERTKK